MESKKITREDREKHLGQKPLVVWFTGLSGSGKTTLSETLEHELYKRGYKTYILDGDNLRKGLCNDLGFSEQDRTENLRRAGEAAKLMRDSGIIVLAAFISPFASDRNMIREMIGAEHLVRVFVACPIDVCEQRDVKGLYKLARSGAIKKFTGISSPFEEPTESELILETDKFSKEHLIEKLLLFIIPKIKA